MIRLKVSLQLLGVVVAHVSVVKLCGITLFLLAIISAPATHAGTKSQSALVDVIFAQYNKSDVPGCALAVIRDGKTIYERGYGLANLEHRVPIDPAKSVFNIASSSKQFTAASVLLLVRDGKLSLDDDVHKFIPELPDFGQLITVDNLLHHTSGLRDYYTLLELGFVSQVDYTTDAQTMALITRQRSLDFKPGSAWGYSSTNYFLLGQIVQRISGQSFREFANERIFKPLGMKNTRFLSRYDQVIPDVATAYQALAEGGFTVNMSNWMTAGPSGLRTTVEDLAKWDNNFYSGKVGGLWLSEQLQQKGALNDGTTIDYGRGLISMDYRGLLSVSHDGGFAGYGAQLLRFPKEKFSVVTLCNIGGSSPRELANKVADVYLIDKLKSSETIIQADKNVDGHIVHPIPDPARFVGTYWNPRQAAVRRIELREGKLFYVRNTTSATELILTQDQRLLLKGIQPETELQFAKESKGSTMRSLRVRIRGVGVIQGGTSALVEVQPFELKADQFKQYAGNFYSAELQVGWSLIERQGQLLLREPRGEETPIQPAFKDAWFLDDILLRFERSVDGAIVGFYVDAGRALNIKFVRMKDLPRD